MKKIYRFVRVILLAVGLFICAIRCGGSNDGWRPVEGGGVPIVMIIHEASHSALAKALAALDSMDVTLGKSFYMRILQEGNQSG